MKKTMLGLAALTCAAGMNAKTLVAYYSYTNNVEKIVEALSAQIDCDVLEVEPAEKGLDYAANNYALGTQLLNAIRNNPTDASSYPAIDPVTVDMAEYDTVIIACPLWWSQMAAPFQTFLFHYGPQMAGKNVGVIVSSSSSGISGVVADAKRLIPEGKFLEPNLWIRSSQVGNASSLISTWLSDIRYNDLTTAVAIQPASELLEIEVAHGLATVKGGCDRIAFYDLAGSKLLDTAGNQADFSHFAPGVYVAQAVRGSRAVTRKVRK